MKPDRPSSSAGKWIAITIVVLGLLAGIAEWKFRIPRVNVRTPATQPAE